MITPFNKNHEYKAYVADKVTELKQLCHMYKIPMFITVCTKNTEEETCYEKEMISAATCGYKLTDNQIAKHVNVTLGFDTVQPTPEMTFDMEDIGSDYIKQDEGDIENE